MGIEKHIGEIEMQDMSGSIAELAKALAKAQANMEAAKKDSKNPYFKSMYADMASTWRACRDELSKNNIAVVQVPVGHSPVVGVKTMLIHSSGEFISGTISMDTERKITKKTFNTKNGEERIEVHTELFNPQEIGSLITYFRRYGLTSMVGLSTEDDDGNFASGGQKQSPAPRKQPLPTLETRKETMLKKFGDLGFDVMKVEEYIGKPVDEIKEPDFKVLGEIYNDLKADKKDEQK